VWFSGLSDPQISYRLRETEQYQLPLEKSSPMDRTTAGPGTRRRGWSHRRRPARLVETTRGHPLPSQLCPRLRPPRLEVAGKPTLARDQIEALGKMGMKGNDM
jgi:hypothetical protein